nr:Ig-like domain-containing protein [Anaerolineae bacterium]
MPAIRWALIFMALGIVACSVPGLAGQSADETAEPGGTPTIDVALLPPTHPKVVLHRPYSGEELPLDGSIDIYFDQPMDSLSVEHALSISPPLEVDTTWVDDSTLRITPERGQLNRATRYTVTISTVATASNGLGFEEAVNVEVETVGFLSVSEVIPADGADAVETDAVITVIFNRPVVPLTTVSGSPEFTVPVTFSPSIPGSGEWVNTSIFQWHPSEPLAGSTTYTASVPAGLEDQTGGLLPDTFTWEFTTLPPDVIAVDPGSASDVELDTPVVVEFNQPMDTASVEQGFLLSSGVDIASGQFEWSDNNRTMTFVPSGLLQLGRTYTVVISADARSASGSALLGREVSWSFDTVLPPYVTQLYPRDGSANNYVWDGLKIVFSAPMDEDTLEDLLVVTPALPDDAYFYYNSYDYSWNVSVQIEPSATYQVTLLPGAADPYGNTITDPVSWQFSTGPLEPWVSFNVTDLYGVYDASRTTELFLQHRNVSRVDFTLSRLTLTEFVSLSESWYGLRDYWPNQNAVVRTWSVDATAPLNEVAYTRVPVVSDRGGSLAPGVYLLIADAPEIEGDLRHLMVVVTANLTVKTSQDETFVWVTDLRTGQPVQGATVQLYNDAMTKVAEQFTNPDGTVILTHPRLENLWERQYALVDSGGVYALARTSWTEGIGPWEFGSIATDYSPQPYSMYLYTDRPIYRSGQTVYFKGILRGVDDVTYSLIPDAVVSVNIYNSRGDLVYLEHIPVNEMGTVSGSFTLDAEADLGYYTMNVGTEEHIESLGFQVAEYRKPEFQVTLEALSERVVSGDTIEVTVRAEYFSGGAVGNAPVSWSVLSDDYYFRYSGPGRYSFYDYTFDWSYWDSYYGGYGELIADGTGTTDANGEFVIQLPAVLDTEVPSQLFSIEAVVEDVTSRTVAGRTSVQVHAGQYYAGVSPDNFVGQAGEVLPADIIVVDWDSTPVANQDVLVELVELRWSSVQEEDESGRTQWVWDLEEIVVDGPTTITTDADGKGRVSFTPEEGGTYKIRATVTDPSRNRQVSSAHVWVSSGRYVIWRQPNNNRIDLVADSDLYQPGDTAEILIASPFQGAVQALVTVERGDVISHEVITMESNSTVYRLPITAEHAPTAYVSVVIIKGVDETNPIPAFRMGLVQINIDPVQQVIDLSVTPDRETVGPREQVTYTIETRDYQGEAVDAEVSLALVDLAILSLAEPNSRNIVDYYYGQQGLGVSTA